MDADYILADEYCDIAWDQVKIYIDGIQNNTITHNKWIGLAVNVFVNDLNNDEWEYDTKEVDRIFRFFSLLAVKTDKGFTQFKMLPFQAFYIASLFGFKIKGTERNKHSTSIMFIARGNGKTPLAVGLSLYLLLSKYYVQPQNVLVSGNAKLADKAFTQIRDFINKSPLLFFRLGIFRTKIIFNDIKDDPDDYFQKNLGYLEVLPYNEDNFNSIQPTAIIFDEIHLYKDESLYSTAISGMHKITNALSIITTTAGKSTDSFCYSFVEKCKNKLLGNIKDDSLHCLLYTLDDGDDVSDERNWIKSNPSLGEILLYDNFKQLYKSFKNGTYNEKKDFKTLNLNLFTTASTEWIPDEEIEKCCNVVNEDLLLGRDCYLGIDLSYTKDMSSIVVLFPKEDGRFDVIPYFFIPNNNESLSKARSGSIFLPEWIEKGFIILSNEKTIDYNQLYDKIIEISDKFNIVSIGYDPWSQNALIPRLKELFFPHEFSQTVKKFTAPLTLLNECIVKETINLGNNPVLRWNFKNVVIKDAEGLIKIDKNKKKDAVDGVVALGIALGTYIDLEVVNDEKANLDNFIKWNT